MCPTTGPSYGERIASVCIFVSWFPGLARLALRDRYHCAVEQREGRLIETASPRYFREVARHGSLRRAAERLFVAQSAISRRIAALEEELGVQLFERRARGMALTAAGQRLLEFADDARIRLDALRARIHEYEALHREHVELTI
jgi:molybdenum-dependent DNA-binding transcriptional regulator ModE